ncbi:MAG: GNAT family N-acetyltransferase [Methanobrevibacter sp.]|nr:GNAT family N-acetyltransferase [Methanobrevibacter sp.]
MQTTDYLKREDNSQKVFLSEGTLDVLDILGTHYSYIYDSIISEDFILKYDHCNLFKELTYDNMVVGFCSYDFSREFITAALNNIYVLPEFRGNGIFAEELKRTMVEHNKVSIMEPTRLVVELLIKHGFAQKINENIVASSIEFVIPGSHVLSNTDYENEELSTHFYDLSICSSIHILDLDKGYIAYSAPLNYDIINYGCLDNRNRIDDDYFTEIKELFENNELEFMKTVLDLEEKLSIKNYTLEEIIGDDESFSPYIESLIDDAHVTYQKALEIKNQIREEYEAGMVLNESLLIRLAYLFDENPEPTIKSHEDVCPYCSMPIDSHDRYCHFCGINLNYNLDEIESNFIEYINTSKRDFDEDIRFIAYKFLKLLDGEIEFEYAVFTIENTYNISWSKLKQFLTANDYLDGKNITDKGYDFMLNHPLHYWQKYHMELVDYTDFENYFWQNDHLGAEEICLNYLGQFSDEEYISDIISEIRKDITN